MTQLPLLPESAFGDKPLPEQVIDELGGDMAYIDTDDGQRLYSVRDWVYWVSGSTAKQRHKPWTDLKKAITKRDAQKGVEKFDDLKGSVKSTNPSQEPVENLDSFQLTDILHTLELDTPGGKQKTDFADANGLYQITQRMADKSPTVRKIKKYLADAGVFLDEARLNPEDAESKISQHRRKRFEQQGRDKAWMETREFSIYTRKQFTQLLFERLGKDAPYGQITNDVYQGIFQRNARELRGQLHLSPQENPRDNLGRLQLAWIIAVEEAARIALEKYGDDDLLPTALVRDLVT